MTTSRIEKITQRIGKIFWDDFNAKAEELVRKEVTKAHQAGKKEGIDEAVEIVLSQPAFTSSGLIHREDTIKALETKKKDNE